MGGYRRVVCDAALLLVLFFAPGKAKGQPTLDGRALPVARENVAYSTDIAAKGGTKPYAYSLTGGALPAGLNLSTAGDVGTVSGIPTENGDFSFEVTVTDAASDKAAANFTLHVDAAQPPLTITSGSPLPSATFASPYSFTFAASGGSGTGYKWTASNLTPGLT